MLTSFQTAGSPFPELSRLQQQLQDLFYTADDAGIRSSRQGSFPAINVGITADAIEVFVFAPGVDPKAIDVTVERGLLTISGERLNSEEDKSTSHYAQERFVGAFRRVISLPEDADPSKVQASCRDGVLHVSVAKREASKPRKISVN